MNKTTLVHKNGRYRIDDRNYAILDELNDNELNDNARISFADLSRKLGINRQSARARILDMESAGIIEGYTVMINWDLIDGGK